MRINGLSDEQSRRSPLETALPRDFLPFVPRTGPAAALHGKAGLPFPKPATTTGRTSANPPRPRPAAVVRRDSGQNHETLPGFAIAAPHRREISAALRSPRPAATPATGPGMDKPWDR